MIEVVIRDNEPALVVGEAEDLGDIALLKVADDGETVVMETTDMQVKPLGKLSKRAIEGLQKNDFVIVAALFKNTLAWAKEVDFGAFDKPPRNVREFEVKMLAELMAQTGFYGEAAVEVETKPTGRKQRKRPGT